VLVITFVNLLIERLEDEEFGCNTGFGDVGPYVRNVCDVSNNGTGIFNV
jgi:hypothetical protein